VQTGRPWWLILSHNVLAISPREVGREKPLFIRRPMQVSYKAAHPLDVFVESFFFDGHVTAKEVPFRERETFQPCDCFVESLLAFNILVKSGAMSDAVSNIAKSLKVSYQIDAF
jgi:hypothetical protein